jgi:hypothetical protein
MPPASPTRASTTWGPSKMLGQFGKAFAEAMLELRKTDKKVLVE